MAIYCTGMQKKKREPRFKAAPANWGPIEQLLTDLNLLLHFLFILLDGNIEQAIFVAC